MKKYAIKRKEHLCNYAKDKNLPVGGTFNGKISKWKGQILTYENKTKRNAIEEYNLVGDIKLDSEFARKLHRYAHHLSSSQILCYNFFKPMMSGEHPTQDLIDIFSEYGIVLTQKAICEFEYDGYKLYPNEGTVFDFHIQDEATELFVEVKYCEQAFGRVRPDSKSKNGQNHLTKFNTIYDRMVKECPCVKKNTQISAEMFLSKYQLFRNVLRVTDKSKYTVFIFSNEHQKLYNEYTEFKKQYIEKQYVNNVIALYWENLMKGKEQTELYNKYFKEDN